MTKRAQHLCQRSAALLFSTLALNLIVVHILPSSGHSYPFWPAAGIAVGFVLVEGIALLPAVWIGSALINLYLNVNAPSLAATLALGTTIQTAVAANLGRHIAGRQPRLKAPQEIISFLLTTGPLACLIGACFSIFAISAHGILEPSELLKSGLTWWAGDVMGIAVMTPITLMILPETRESWKGRAQKLAIPSILLALLTQIAFTQAIGSDSQKTIFYLTEVAKEGAQRMANTLDKYSEISSSINRLYASSQHVDRGEFLTFTDDIFARHPGLHGLSWNPIVPAPKREDFERELQEQFKYPNLYIKEKSASGAFIRAKKRDIYVPVALIEPHKQNRPALGYDILSSPLRKEAIESALATGNPQATKPITLVQESGNQQGILFLDPMQSSKGETQGFAVAVLRMGDLVHSIFPDNETRLTSGFRWILSTEEGEILATHGVEDRLDEQSTVTNPITFGGRTWSLSLTPTRQAIASASTTLPQQLLMACLVAVLANQAFFLMATGRDVERESIARINEDLARHDPLTNLVNRRALQEELERALEESTLNEESHSLLYLDLDHFKPINDQEGHDAGDEVLLSVCKQVSKVTRKSDTFARIGGDEFAIILKNCSTSKAEEVGQKILALIREKDYSFNGKIYSVTASIGLVKIRLNSDINSFKDLLNKADKACYLAKKKGRNRLALLP